MARKAKAEPIVFENTETGEKIIIEFSRAVIVRMEREGFSGQKVAASIEDMPIDTAIKLLYYGMLMHQPETTLEEATDFFFENVGFSEGFMSRIGELYAEPYTALSEATSKNAKWKML